MSLGERIIAYRARHNMSQEDFANLVKLNVMTISSVENGKHEPTKITAAKIDMFLRKDENNAESNG